MKILLIDKIVYCIRILFFILLLLQKKLKLVILTLNFKHESILYSKKICRL